MIYGWFGFVRNMVVKYGVLDDDIWNFDKIGFLMGQIFFFMIVISSDGRAKVKKIQPGNREWIIII